MKSINVKEYEEMILKIAKEIQNHKDYLCRIDAAIGDGDHGVSMAKGFKKVEDKLKNSENLFTIAEVNEIVGLTLLQEIGGATGPLFSTIFLSSAKIAGDRKEVDLDLLSKMFTAAVEDVCKLGKSKPGDKTLIDALKPAAEALSQAARDGLSIEEGLNMAYQNALAGVEATKEMTPKQGKARYLKDRAIGHQDAGATSISIMFKAMKEYLDQL
jgi:dihydroxyacetone kinase-like protein